jgi:hypothetical protein
MELIYNVRVGTLLCSETEALRAATLRISVNSARYGSISLTWPPYLCVCVCVCVCEGEGEGCSMEAESPTYASKVECSMPVLFITSNG